MPALYEFHVSRRARDRYQFDLSLFALSGNVLLPDVQAARRFARQMNERRNLARHPARVVRAGDLFAMGLIDEILHFVAALYREQVQPDAMRRSLAELERRLGRETLEATLRRFAEEFPPVAVYRGETGLESYLAGATAGTPHREVQLEELLLLWLANANPAFGPAHELFEDIPLTRETAYPETVGALRDFFTRLPPFGPDRQDLVEMLRGPAVVSPHSLAGQLAWIRSRWGHLLGRLLSRFGDLDALLLAIDLLREEEDRPVFGGPGPSLPPDYASLRLEGERYSPDLDWMPRLVLIAKNTHVWLSQLSREYGREIARLDGIPDAELDRLARAGFTGLWLIGVWERSPASRTIKRRMGIQDAEASAYSIRDYVVAGDLGGDEALADLRERAGRRGIRLASDMVPNHVGIDARWVVEHPDWFLSVGEPPFPSYRFEGPDLSTDGRVGIFLEDHYYDRSDAAVVFKRLDRWTGSATYIYHGNDGTHTPWNDTAQLDYLRPDVREAAIRTILHVARQFPILRFDAAMTLTRQHYQRLWFPQPGAGGAIPSRAERGMTREQFDAAMPHEFWREVVDRAAVEAPDTLLLAEAFWLLEGYFVRTLGMHRVYNSAFMNMLRDEENAKYRSVIRNTLEFDPEILKRYVNFLSNPDEKTAVEQFGKGDKYFGICTMMATLPGLPMFGHGQIEGYEEKYGMEFRHPRRDERPDPGMLERHEREIFPLLRRRALFAGVESFRLYDFYHPAGRVCEDVFAYSNRHGEERALVVYHNRYAEARGWIRTSTAFRRKGGHAGEDRLVSTRLGEDLGLRAEPGDHVVFRDLRDNLEYVRESRSLREQGLYLELNAYRCHVFLGFRELRDSEEVPIGTLARELGGRGVPGVEAALREIRLRPVRAAFQDLLGSGPFADLLEDPEQAIGPVERPQAARKTRTSPTTARPGGPPRNERFEATLRELHRRTIPFRDDPIEEGEFVRDALRKLETLIAVQRGSDPATDASRTSRLDGDVSAALDALRGETHLDPAGRAALAGWLFLEIAAGPGPPGSREGEAAAPGADPWDLCPVLSGMLRELGFEADPAEEASLGARVLRSRAGAAVADLPDPGSGASVRHAVVETWFADEAASRFLGVNRHEGILWYGAEAFDRLVTIAACAAASRHLGRRDTSRSVTAARLRGLAGLVRTLRSASSASRYQVERLLQKLERPS